MKVTIVVCTIISL